MRQSSLSANRYRDRTFTSFVSTTIRLNRAVKPERRRSRSLTPMDNRRSWPAMWVMTPPQSIIVAPVQRPARIPSPDVRPDQRPDRRSGQRSGRHSDPASSPWGHIVVLADAAAIDAEDLRTVVAVGEILTLRLSDLHSTRRLTTTLQRSRQQVIWLRETLRDRVQIIGRSPAMRSVVDQVRKVSDTQSAVLIRGETGVGKELIANAIHHASDRRDGPMVRCDCGTTNARKLERQWFGREADSSGEPAVGDRPRSRLESAHRGTILLNEIAELPPSVQARLVEFLKDHRLDPTGQSASIEIDVRVIAATRRDLRSMVDQGTLRQDLYYALHVVEITVPPLRDRGDDILLLANHFLDHFAKRTGRPMSSIDPAAATRMQNYRWPGNVRELRNVIERAVVMDDGETLRDQDLLLTPAVTGGDAGESLRSVSVETTLAELETVHIDRVLHYTQNNKSRAAAILGIQRSTLDRKLKRRTDR